MEKNRVFSGIRPSAKIHLGNYLGAIKNWIELQDPPSHKASEGTAKPSQAIFAVVDLHGITTPYAPGTYHQQIMDTVLDYLAAGVDPKKSLLIRQSRVPQHSELAWLFNTITPLGWLDRLPTYLEKKDQVENSGHPKAKSWLNNVGILNYPVLMAADILIYKSNLVPVGNEQLKHIDVTNEIANKFNYLFGEIFEPVKPHVAQGSHILSLQDPTKKMSKTGDDGIALSDEPDIVRAKFKKATTDSGKEIKFDEKEKPGISNLLTIYSLLSGKNSKDLEKNYEGKGYVEFKNDLAEVVVEFLKPFQEKRRGLEKDMQYVESILKKSEEKARHLAEQTMKEVREKMGF